MTKRQLPHEKYSLVECKRKRKKTATSAIGLCVDCKDWIPLKEQDILKDSRKGWVSRTLQYERKDTYPGLPILARSAEDGCQFCELLFNAVLSRPHTSTSPVEVMIRFEYFWDGPDPFEELPSGPSFLVATLSLLAEHHEEWLDRFVFTVEADRDILATYLGIKAAPEKETLCRKNVQRMREILAESLEACGLIDDANRYTPTRLLDLRESGNEVPRLILTQESGQNSSHKRLEYAALSYCWGPPSDASTNLQTRKDSIHNFLSAVDFEHMPAAIQDAVTVCRALSIRYLWVDTLCIIQDDQGDWENESQNMGNVFQNAYVTLCALVSTTCRQGFLKRSTSSALIPFQSVIEPGISGKYLLTHHSAISDKGWYRGKFSRPLILDVDSSKWTTRGWTFQEAQMSKRLLYFGNSRFHFSCNNMQYSENLGATHNVSFSHLLEVLKIIRLNKTEPQALRLWYEIMARYNQTSFTHQKDKLPALSGMASCLAEATGDNYMVGLWRNDLARGLIWESEPMKSWDDLKRRLSAPNAVNAPSWSWLAHGNHFGIGTREFYINDADITPEYSVVDIDIDLAGSSTFGRVNRAVLTISGKVVLLTSNVVRLSQRKTGNWMHPMWCIQFDGRSVYHCDPDWLPKGRIASIPPGLTLVKIASCSTYILRKRHRTYKVVWGLLLIPTGTHKEYRRVGVFSSHSYARSTYDPFKDCELQTIRLI